MFERRESGQGQFFYAFDLDKVVPPDDLVRQIDGLLDLSWVHNWHRSTRILAGLRLIVDYVFALRSERRLCAEVHVNLAYRWFCRLGIEDRNPDHSVFCRARRERSRPSDALTPGIRGCCGAVHFGGTCRRRSVLGRCQPDQGRCEPENGIEGEEGLPSQVANRAVEEYLAVLDDAGLWGRERDCPQSWVLIKPVGTYGRDAADKFSSVFGVCVR